jgi:dipeptidyl aminopeptidase/acylaminoacyl peptidase
MLEDLDNAIKAVSKFPEINKDKICLIGHSQGAYVSFLKAAKDKRIKCLVSWMGQMSDFTDFLGIAWFEEIERKGYYSYADYKVTKKYVQIV